MKLRDLGWPRLVLKDTLRLTSRSFPTLKAYPTQALNRLKARATDPPFARSSEEISVNVDQPLRLLEPRPEPDSGSITPPNLAPDNSKSSLTAPLQVKGVDINPKLSLSGLGKIKDPSPPSQALLPPNPVMHLRVSGTISPLSDGSFNDLIQTASNSRDSFDLTEPPNVPTEGGLTPSIDDPTHAKHESPTDSGALGDHSNGLTSALSSTQAMSSLPSTHSKIIGATTFDGPALDMDPTKPKDSSHTAARPFLPISEDTESVFSMELPISDLNAAEIASLRGSVNSKPRKVAMLMSTSIHNLSTSINLPTNSVFGTISIPSAQGIPKVSGLQSASAVQISSMLPLDATGCAIEPPTPAPNQSKKHKLKTKAKKVIRYTRILVLRKSVLRVILGKKLAAPTHIALKMDSRLESVGSEALTAAGPVNASNIPNESPV